MTGRESVLEHPGPDDVPARAADEVTSAGDGPARASGGPWWQRAWRWAHAHPMLVVAGVALVVTVVQCAWIWEHRLLGALDPDEAGYIGSTFRYRRILGSDPLALPRAVGGTGTAPLVPLLSVPLLWFGPDDVRTVLFMQPILMGVTAIASAGIARRLAGSGAAMVTGVVFLLLPTVVFASQTYWLGLGAAASMALGIWALVSSDRLTNRWLYAYGACVGAMLLSRTMTVGFLPAMAVAGIVVAGRRRDAWIGLVKAGATAIAVAGPWYFVAREAVFGYLFSYGYGDRADLFGEATGPLDRAHQRVDRILLGVGNAETWALLVVLCSVAVLAWRREGWPEATRSALAIGAAAALGIAALASTDNNGVWFELPIIALLVPLVVALGSRAPAIVKGVALVPVLGVGLVQLGCALWVIAPGPDPIYGIDTVHRVAQYEYGFEQYDPRFGPYRRDELAEAAADWWAVSSDVERYLRDLTPDGQKVLTTSGNFEMFNSNTVQLAGELHGWTPRTWIPDTVAGADERAEWLTPTARDDAGTVVTDPAGEPVERILLLALHDQHLFTPDAEVEALHAEAVAAGWEVARAFPLPEGGEVVVMRHPDAP